METYENIKIKEDIEGDRRDSKEVGEGDIE